MSVNVANRVIDNTYAMIEVIRKFYDNASADVTLKLTNADGTISTHMFENRRKFEESIGFKINSTGDGIVDLDGNPISLHATVLQGIPASAFTDDKFKFLLDTNKSYPEAFMCGVTESNDIIAWGRNIIDVSGNDDNGGSYVLNAPEETNNLVVKKIISAAENVFVIYGNEADDNANLLYGMGKNSSGQLGQGNTTDTNQLEEITATHSGDKVRFVDIATSTNGGTPDQNAVLALDSNGNLWGWGRNGAERPLGFRSTNDIGAVDSYVHSPTLVTITGLRTGELPSKIFVNGTGLITTYFITTSGRVFCAGNNAQGQLGQGDTLTHLGYQVVGFSLLTEVVTDLVYAGGYIDSSNTRVNEQSCLVLTQSGKIYAWGFGGDGELGQGNTNSLPRPTEIAVTGKTFTKIRSSIGGETTYFAITNDNLLYGWGFNGDGILGQNNTNAYTSPVEVPVGTNETIKDIYVAHATEINGAQTALVITNSNKVYTAGNNRSSQLGTGVIENANDQYQRIRMKYGSEIKQVAFCGIGNDMTWFLLLNDRRVLTWGSNNDRQAKIYAHNTTTNVPFPQIFRI